jgi:hypothetical protein
VYYSCNDENSMEDNPARKAKKTLPSALHPPSIVMHSLPDSEQNSFIMDLVNVGVRRSTIGYRRA